MSEIPKTYDPSSVESKWYRYWLDNDLFSVAPDSGRKPYCIMMPPPNITGELHMGHGLQDSIQDYLIRMKRMQGLAAHWQPGTDHAGIATQNVVEKSLAKEGVTRHQLGREAFIERVWQWREKYGSRILQQKHLLGDSPDWSRGRFTLDAGLSRAVAKVFVHLYEKGLIYRGNYIVNWCPRCHTAVSDEEVDHLESDGHLWHFRYPLEGKRGKGKGESRDTEYVTVATTRPETMLGDTAVAINPRDDRLRHLVGRSVMLPLANRVIPVIEDDFVDPSFGTGQVKVTPAHDPNDFEMGRRHNLPSMVVLDERGAMNGNCPEAFRGLDRFKAREAIVKALDEAGLLEKVEPYKTSIGHCSRCKTVIEPYLSLQWFVRMKPLAEPALQVVREGKIHFFPSRWEKVYYSWLENVRDWCISRQLWWGHRLPVWYCRACGEVIVREEAPDLCPKCGSASLEQDEDVLDTWFSSWLWPFSTLGWPHETPELRYWYPTDVLVSGYDIIFFWIARMIMAGLEFRGDVPFRDVFITGMIKDEQGRWMSKSLGNGIDPAEMVARYGADAVRFTMVTLATEGQDIKLAPSRFEGGRNFANKLWNAYRFLMLNTENTKNTESFQQVLVDFVPFVVKNGDLSDRWIVSRLGATVEQVQASAEKYRLYECLQTIYDFLWKDYCDWYLEMLKGRLTPETPANAKAQALGVALGVFEAAMRLLHPGMPFITEEIWQGIMENGKWKMENGKSIMVSEYPQAGKYPRDAKAEEQFDLLQRLITAIRTIRSEMRVPPERKAYLHLLGLQGERRWTIEKNLEDMKRLAGLGEVRFDGTKPLHSASAIVDETELFIPLEGLIDLAVERARLDKEAVRLQGVIKSAEAKLANPDFRERAPAEVIAYEEQKAAECQVQLEAVGRNRKALD